MRRSIRRAREGDNPPAPPAVNRGFVIPPEYQNMENGDPFLRFDNNDPNDRILIFGTDDSLGFLANADDWYMDGTFTVAPPQFNQLYTVHGLSGDHHVVGCYALLPNKNRGTYVELLQQVHRLTNGAAPRTIMIDFEQVCIGTITMVFEQVCIGAITMVFEQVCIGTITMVFEQVCIGAITMVFEQVCIGAITMVFPNASVYGCLFHLTKSIYRHVQANGLQQQYLNDNLSRTNIRMIGALAFVPLADILQSFNVLSQHCVGNEQGILDYFETNYIGEVRRGRRRPPMFPHTLWNIHRRVVNDLPRTNNLLEGWHRHFNQCDTIAHPTIWKLIKALRRDATIQQVRVGHFIAGNRPPQQRRAYQDVNDRIKNLVNTYNQRPTIDFLRGISYNLAQ